MSRWAVGRLKGSLCLPRWVVHVSFAGGPCMEGAALDSLYLDLAQ